MNCPFLLSAAIIDDQFPYLIMLQKKLDGVNAMLTCAGLMGANQLDGWPLVIGVHTVFRQVHKSLNEQFIKYIAQYTHSHLKAFTR